MDEGLGFGCPVDPACHRDVGVDADPTGVL